MRKVDRHLILEKKKTTKKYTSQSKLCDIYSIINMFSSHLCETRISQDTQKKVIATINTSLSCVWSIAKYAGIPAASIPSMMASMYTRV